MIVSSKAVHVYSDNAVPTSACVLLCNGTNTSFGMCKDKMQYAICPPHKTEQADDHTIPRQMLLSRLCVPASHQSFHNDFRIQNIWVYTLVLPLLTLGEIINPSELHFLICRPGVKLLIV